MAACYGLPRDTCEQIHASALALLAPLRRGQPAMVADTAMLSGLPGASLLTAHNVRTLAAAPMLHEGRLVGALSVLTRGEMRPFSDDEIGFLRAIADQAANAVAKARLHQSLEREQRLRGELLRNLISAQEEERKRIARELHDSTSQSLTSLLVGLRALEQSTPENLHQQTESLRQIVGRTLEEVHALAWQLRPSALDDLGLPAALERYVADFRERYGLPVDLVIHGLDESRLSSEVETSIYRIVQEALTNTARHADADRVSVLVEHRDGKTLAIVEDNGVGFDPTLAEKGSRQHLGLYGIRERAELLGGKLHIESNPGRGTSLFVEFPDMPPARPNHAEDLTDHER